MAAKLFEFGAYKINEAHVFFSNALIYAFVNLKPLVPNHVLISPIRVVQHMEELTDDELVSLTDNARKLSKLLGEQCDIACQDGVAAGQTVAHVHLHVVPTSLEPFVVPEVRHDRTFEEMKEETDLLRKMCEGVLS